MVSVSEAWAALESEGRSEPGWHTRRVRLGAVCDIRGAIRLPERTEAVLFEVAAKSVPPGMDPPDCVGFALDVESIAPGPNGRARLCLVLRDKRFRDVFATLTEDVVSVVAGSDAESNAVKLLLGRLNTWQRFISRFGPDRLSDERQIGLYAELRFLKQEVIPLLPAASAVRSWRGPYLEPQDFRFRNAAVEIKATASKNPATFPVSNLDQLDHGSIEALFVFHLPIEMDGATGETLPQAVADIRASLALTDPAAAADFDSSLIESGYLDAHAPHYDSVFRAREPLWLHVGDAFPRLTRSAVPLGVASASYSVSLEACLPYSVDASTGRQLLQARL